MWHRRNWNIVFPWLELDDDELADLTTHGTYVAGFTDPAVEGRTELYDLFVNGGCPLKPHYIITCTIHSSYMTLIGVHEMPGRMYPN